MLRWSEFEHAAPEIAETGRQLLYDPNEGKVAILATLDGIGRPRVAPICPIFTDEGVYLLAGKATPKVAQLEDDPNYAMHALIGSDDLEFQIRGQVRRVEHEGERELVLAAVSFPSFDRDDPIFELLITNALAVVWPQPGQSEKRTWPS